MHHNCPFHEYYLKQAGTGIGPVYKGAYYQRGHGLGSFLKGLFRTIFPLLKSGVKSAGVETLKGGVNLINDIMENKPFNEAFKNRLNEVGNNLKEKSENKLKRMVGAGKKQGIKRKKTLTLSQKSSNNKRSNKNKKIKYSDIFS